MVREKPQEYRRWKVASIVKWSDLSGSMELKPGAKLGPYEILSRIGAGGMGEVWKARDTRLDRIVAIKTSSAKFSDRFEREARAVAALNHPHICALYDVGPDYLVMEYVEGAEIKGPLPLDEALKYGAQICDALDAAHKKNITHRDLKPANILVTKAGVKLLDFGLAKMGPAVKADEATMTMALTGKNEIVGTLLYMPPEQLQSKDTDARSDIFSFGLVLYEMLTGKRAFDGGNAASIIAAILERPAPSVAEVAPAALDRVVKKCLAKDPDDRWQSARDLKDELVWIAGGGTEVPRQAEVRPTSKWVWGAAFLAGAAIAALAVWMLKPVPAKPVSRTVITLGPDEHLANLNDLAIAISPDGAYIVYVATRGSGRAQLFLRRLDAFKAEPVAGTEDAVSPFFSPDSQWIAFFADGKLKKVAVGGGAAITLYDAITALGETSGTWGPNNTILFQRSNGLFLEVSASGDALRRVTATAKHPVWRWPEFLPGGRAVVFAGGTAALSFATNASHCDGCAEWRGYGEGSDCGRHYAAACRYRRSDLRAKRNPDGRSVRFKAAGAGRVAHAGAGGRPDVDFWSGAVWALDQWDAGICRGRLAGFLIPPGVGKSRRKGTANRCSSARLQLPKALP